MGYSRRFGAVLIALLCNLALGATPASAKLRIVATVPDLAAIAREVAGDGADVESLSLPTQDPHFVDARPNLALSLNRADVLLVVGLELEVGWLPTLLGGARNGKIQPGASGYLDCSTVVSLKEVPQGKVERSQGDIHPGGNPHYLTDPRNAVRVAQAIAKKLAALDGGAAKTYADRASRFEREVQGAIQGIAARFKPFRGRQVVTFHASWIYFTDFLGLSIAAYLEPKAGVPPSAVHVLRVINEVRAKQVKLVLQEEYYPDRTATLVADKTGAKLVLLSGGTHVQQGERYVDRLRKMTERVAQALEQAK